MPPPAPFCLPLLPSLFPLSHHQDPLPSLFHCLLHQLQELLFCPLILKYKDQTQDVNSHSFKLIHSQLHSRQHIDSYIHPVNSSSALIPYIHPIHSSCIYSASHFCCFLPYRPYHLSHLTIISVTITWATKSAT